LLSKEISTLMTFSEQQTVDGPRGSLDGDGAGDHDQPYRFGWRPRASVPYPFNTRQYARLLILRSRVRGQLSQADENAATGWQAAA
jgi:hypothetical protein